MMRRMLGAILLLGAFTPTSLLAQSTGGLRVRVTDSEGPLPGATVTIRNGERRIGEHSTLSDRDGRVDFPVLPAGGAYEIEVSFPGYATVILDDLRVRSGEHPTIPVRLVDEYTETVKIVGDRPVVDLERSSSTAKFSDDFIGDLPVQGRFYQNVLTLAPGVQDANEDGNPNVHGSRARDFRAMVGGVANVDPLTGKYRANVNPNSIEEIEVITSGAGPEYGRAQGGFANIVLKQGSNRFEGVFDFIYRSDRFDGDGAGDVRGASVPEFEWIQPSVQVSGPIVKDRLWYRLSHEWIDRDDPLNVLNSLVVVNTEQRIHSDQITWQLSDRNKLALRYESNPTTITNFGVSSLTPASAAQIRGFEADTWSVVWSAPYSPQLYVESVAAWQDGGLSIGPTNAGGANTCVRGIPAIELAQCEDVYTGQISGPYWRDFRDDRQRFTVRSDATFYPRRPLLGMDHQLKVGFIIENERYLRDITDRPRIDFYSQPLTLGSLLLLGITEPQGTVLAEIPVPPSQRATATGATVGLYFKDQMRPRENVVVEVGVRVDREVVNAEGRARFDPVAELQTYNELLSQGLTEARARQLAFTAFEDTQGIISQMVSTLSIPPQLVTSIFGPITVASGFQSRFRRPADIELNNTNVSPFLSASWDPWSNGKTKLAFTAGRYYNNIPLVIPTWELAPATVRIALGSERIEDEWIVQGAEQRALANPTASLFVVDRDLSTPYQDEFTLTFQRELAQETSLGVTFVRREYRDQFQDVDINHRTADLGTCFTVTRPGEAPIVPVPDGIVDDCVGLLEQSSFAGPSGRPIVFQRPDGIPDLYTMNPFWGTINEIGNYNEADYEAIQLELVRRQYRGWELQGSYVWSIAEGNGEDFDQLLGNDQSLIEDERGFQSSDQRHVVKIAGTKVTPWGVRLGGVVVWQSGLPYSILRESLSLDAIPPTVGFGGFEPRPRVTYPTGTRNDRRNPSFWDLSVKATKEFIVGRADLQLSVEVFNLLNEGTYTIYNQFLETGFQINGENDAYRRFGRRYQLGVRIAF